MAAIAHGAHFTLVGRAYLYGLMAGGRAGVDRAIEILRGQVERTMQLLGVATLDELEPQHVTALRRLAPMEDDHHDEFPLREESHAMDPSTSTLPRRPWRGWSAA